MKRFQAKSPLEYIAMDLLGEFVRTPRGNRWLLVIADRLVRTISLSPITSYEVARAFVTHWVFTYGPPVSVLTDNGPQFVS